MPRSRHDLPEQDSLSFRGNRRIRAAVELLPFQQGTLFMRRPTRSCLIAIIALLFVELSASAAGIYPQTITANAKAVNGATTVTSTITIRIDRLVEPSRRDRLIEGLKRDGYQGF